MFISTYSYMYKSPAWQLGSYPGSSDAVNVRAVVDRANMCFCLQGRSLKCANIQICANIYTNFAFARLKSHGSAVGGDPVAGSGLGAAEPGGDCEGPGLPPRPGPLPGPPQSGRPLRNPPGEWGGKREA